MISLPRPWKKDLTRLADKLQRRSGLKRWTASSTAAFEKEVFMGAFVVRKLMDSGHVSHVVSGKTHRIIFYRIRDPNDIGSKIKHFTHGYQLARGNPEDIPLRKLMDQLVHSYHFSPFVPFRQGMDGIFFASDWSHRNRLYYFPLPKLVEVFRSVGRTNLHENSDARTLNRPLQ
jgi:hypothetical protein